MKLSLKLFAAFFASSLVILAVFVLMQVLAARSFEDYLKGVEVERSSRLLVGLQGLFDETDGWEPLRRNPPLWRDLLHGNGFDIQADPQRRAKEPATGEPRETDRDRARRDRRPPPRRDRGGSANRPPPRQGEDLRSPAEGPHPPRAREDQGDPWRSPPPTQGEDRGKPAEGPPSDDPLGLGPRLSVHDSSKAYVVGDRTPPDRLFLRPVVVDGTTVGWLGLRSRRSTERPLETTFMNRQLGLAVVVGGCLLLVTGLIGLLIGRQVVRPVKVLSRATQSLARRNLDTRIDFTSKDEFGQLADDFNRMAATIQAFEDERRRWISDISHELRTPIAILRGEIEAVHDGVRELRSETLDSLYAEVTRLGGLVEDLHQLSLGDTGTQTLHLENIDLNVVIQGAVGLARESLGEHGISLRLELSSTPATIRGDRDRLQQVITNLLENCRRYAGTGAEVTVRTISGAGDIVLEIEDSGVGVPEESLPHLFERLYRVEKSRSRKLGGSGLGLAICKQIVNTHDGEIRARNRVGGGLVVTISLPRVGRKKERVCE